MSKKHTKLMGELELPKRLEHFIAGTFQAAGERTIPSIDPTTQQKIADIPQATPQEIEAAVAASRAAQRSWAKLAP